MNKLKLIHTISDIHFGVKRDERLYEKLEKYFINEIDNDETDLVIVAGDLYDKILKGSDPAMFYAITFINLLCDKATKRGFSIRIIKGTKTHDSNQLRLFKHLESRQNIDFKIIETVQEEEIKGLKVLYIPEEYIEDKEEYYKNYLNDEKRYDIIFFHGNVDFVSYSGKITSERNVKNAPTFKTSEFINSAYLSLGGHVHTGDSFDNKIFYTGSFEAFCFGEPDNKGFLKTTFDPETKEYEVTRIFNEESEKFLTIDFNKDLEGSLEDKIETIEEMKKQFKNVRIICEDAESNREIIEGLKNVSGEGVKIKISNGKNKKEKSEFDYILKRELPMDKTIQRYIEQTQNKKISLKNINNFIKEEKDEEND